MRHIIAPQEKNHSPTPNYNTQSRILLIVLIATHPAVAILCKMSAAFLDSFTVFLFSGLANIYSVERNAHDFNFREIAESDSLYPMYLAGMIFLVALFSGVFRVFRIKKSFWANFIISVLLLLLGLVIFS